MQKISIRLAALRNKSRLYVIIMLSVCVCISLLNFERLKQSHGTWIHLKGLSVYPNYRC